MSENNMALCEKVAAVPKEAQKIIGAGRLKGFTDINPMWRIKKLTEIYGPCGIGWKPVITRFWTETGSDNEIAAFCTLDLYIRDNGVWSDPIPGIGGSKLKTMEKSGAYVSDECYKMAYTDALSVACKLLGVGADVYWDKGRSGSKYQETNPVSAHPVSTDDNPLGTCCACCGKPIHDTTIDGKTWPVDVIVTESIKRYGVPLHIDCSRTYKPKKEDK